MGKEEPNHGSWRATRMMGSRGRKENTKRDEEKQLSVGFTTAWGACMRGRKKTTVGLR